MTPSFLDCLGWDEQFAAHTREGFEFGRISIEYQHIYGIMTESGELLAEVTGTLRHEARGPLDYPAVGDWVHFRMHPGGERAAIHAVIPRRSRFIRKAPGRVAEEQIVAANVDTVLLVSALSEEFNVRRIERYLTMARESGAEPVIVLNKSDLAASSDVAEEFRSEVAAVAPGVAVLVVSAKSGDALDEVGAYLAPGKTIALIGSSGVGKSTIINSLAGEELQATREVRIRDGKGRHTTTHRELLMLPGGGVVIDTPGLRELHIWESTEAIESAFEDIETLAADCRFNDCRHGAEPDCAVRAAVEAGDLDTLRFESYLRLRGESEALRQRRIEAAWKSKGKERAIHRSMRKVTKKRT